MDLIEMARDLVKTQIAQRNVDVDNIGHWLRTTHSTLLNLWVRERGAPTVGREALGRAPIDWRASIGRDAIVCLICGRSFKQLSPRHLSVHGITAKAYRERFRMPPRQPLSARRSTARRREIMREQQPWRLAPHYGRGAK